MNTKNTNIIRQNNVFLWIALGTVALLMIPLVANWPWTLSDFIVMGVLIAGTSGLFVLSARRMHKKYHLAVGAAFLFAFLWLWAELAVGIFTSWGS